jgi:hypothetical protein
VHACILDAACRWFLSPPGTILEGTLFNHFFCNRGAVISDLNSPGAIAFTLMPYAPNSKAINCTNILTLVYYEHRSKLMFYEE